jgi:RNA polymerase sigma-70 factor (ECF subfamily)
VSNKDREGTFHDDRRAAKMTTLAAGGVNHDRDLVARHLYGDPEAFEEVYDRFSRLVFQIARRMSGDEALAEDLSQEIFLRIFRHLEKFQGKSSLKTWVYRVAINCCRSRLSRRTRRGRSFVDVEDERLDEMPTTTEGPQARVRRREAAETVGRALALLPLKFREAVVLRDICGLGYAEIAVATGVRLGTVRSRIARGRDRLRVAIERSSS